VVYALALALNGGTLLPGSASAMLVAQSVDGGRTWSAPTALISDGAQVFNDKGSITADPTDANYVYAAWDRLTAQNAGPAYFAVTANGGANWQAARNMYDPGPQGQTLGNQIVVLPGVPYGVVLDIFTEFDTMGGVTLASLRAIRSTDHGTTWSPPVTISSLTAVGTSDPATGTPVRDGSDLVSVSVGPGGIVYVVWQDARFSGDHDGIAMAHSTDGGVSWSVPVQVNAAHQAQAFTPTVRVRADGVIGVSYFDLRNNIPSSTALLADCWLVTSRDGGANFRETHLSGPFNLDLAPNANGLFLGDYQSLADANGVFLPLYVQTDPGTQVRSDTFISFPPAAAAAQYAVGGVRSGAFSVLAAPAGVTLTPAVQQRVIARTRLVQALRLHRGG
jgi:hypothetical protein